MISKQIIKSYILIRLTNKDNYLFYHIVIRNLNYFETEYLKIQYLSERGAENSLLTWQKKMAFLHTV